MPYSCEELVEAAELVGSTVDGVLGDAQSLGNLNTRVLGQPC